MANMKHKGTYRISEVADMLEVSRITVWRWCKDGKMAHVLLPSGQFRISHDEVMRFMSDSMPFGIGAVLNDNKTIVIRQWQEDGYADITIALSDVDPLCTLLAQLKAQAEES